MTWRVEDRRDSFKNICHQRKYKQQKTKTTDKIWEYFGGLDKIKQWSRWHLVDDTSLRKSARKQNFSPLSCSSWSQRTSKIVKNSRHLNKMFFLRSRISLIWLCLTCVPLCYPNCQLALSSIQANLLTCLSLGSAFISKTYLVLLFQNGFLSPLCLSKNPWSPVQDQPAQEVIPVSPPTTNTG